MEVYQVGREQIFGTHSICFIIKLNYMSEGTFLYKKAYNFEEQWTNFIKPIFMIFTYEYSAGSTKLKIYHANDFFAR